MILPNDRWDKIGRNTIYNGIYTEGRRQPISSIYRGYMALAEAIILQAVKDYRRALKAKNKDKIDEVEKFFRGRHFARLTELDPEMLIRALRNEIENLDNRRKHKRRRQRCQR